MILGRESSFKKDHFDANSGTAPKHLCELVVYSLELVAQLAHSGLEFRFKGGNSLLVLLEDPHRFSIDADIVTTIPKDELIALVEGIAESCEVFRRCEVRQHKTKPWLPMVSFKLWFESCYQDAEEAFVMLDAVLEPAPYPGVRRPVRCGELYSSDETVEVPTISGLLADKLLCLGPGTLGIPLGKGKEAHRLKHVFDVALLSKQAWDLGEVMAAIVPCMEQENRIQRSAWGLPEVIEDTRKFCSDAEVHAEKPSEDTLEPGTYLDEIVRGFDGFRQHLFRVNYEWTTFRKDLQAILGVLDAIEGAKA